ncbi:hypothetical protein ACSBR2_039348 [Camellia fascicularis]
MWGFQVQDQTSTQTSKALPIATLVLRVITLISLVVSLITIASDKVTINGDFRVVTVRFNHIYAYRYMLCTIVLGMTYTLLQITFAIHHAIVGKPLTKRECLLQFEFYGDKVLLSLLATGVGAAFGATLDLKRNLDGLDESLEQYGIGSFYQTRSKLDHFFNIAYVSTAFLLIAFLCSLVSSTLSSLSLSKVQ